MSTEQDERFLKELWNTGTAIVKSHPDVMNKLLGFFNSRDISPDQEREIEALVEKLKPDVKESRDLPSDASGERILPALVAIGTFAASNPGVVKSIWKGIKKFW
jgi:hypothetical protein